MRTSSLTSFTLLLLLNFSFSASLIAQNKVDENGLKQGKWIKYQNNKKVYEGQFINDTPVGTFDYYYPNGHLKIKTTYSDRGRLNRTKLYFDDKQSTLQAEGNYLDKNKDSTWNFYNKTGQLVATENYSKGLKQGDFKVFNQRGHLHLLREFEQDTLHGQSKEYYENEVLFRLISYQKGIRTGAFKLYYSSGKLFLEGKYKEDLRDSIWTTYLENGEIEFLDHYQKGILEKRTDKSGRELKIKPEDETIPLNIDPSQFDPSAIKK